MQQGEDVALEGARCCGGCAAVGDPEDAAGDGALLAPEADAKLDAEVTFFVAPGVDAVGTRKEVGASDEACPSDRLRMPISWALGWTPVRVSPNSTTRPILRIGCG